MRAKKIVFVWIRLQRGHIFGRPMEILAIRIVSALHSLHSQLCLSFKKLNYAISPEVTFY